MTMTAELFHPMTPTSATHTRDEDQRWQSVLARDCSADGSFFYAVRSTGIVCRPSCPSRRPLRHNVEFFPTLDAALRAGYRTCGRCGPEQLAESVARQRRLAEQAAEHLHQHIEERISTEQLAAMAGVERLTLMRAFRAVFGVSPAAYVRNQRLQRFERGMSAADASVTEAIYGAGYGSNSRLYEKTAAMGVTPRQMRQGEGMVVEYTTADSPLGRMLVATTEKGICSITFGSNDAELQSALLQRFPQARQRQAHGWLADAIAFVAAQLTESPLAATFPLDVRATAFQQRVWEALRRIPRGETMTYSGLATELGAPKSTRAVASACAANPVAIVVPCHRVVGKDGSLTGYRWGTERKRRLLDAERRGTISA